MLRSDLPTRLDRGHHRDPAQGVCVMEVVSLLAKEQFTDQPTCTNAVITLAAQRVNDRLDDAERQRLWVLLPRIMRARRTPSDRRINVRLACWSARRVLHLVNEADRPSAEKAIETAEAWLRGEATEQECRDAAYADDAAYVASASAYAASAASAASSAYVASAAYAAYADDAAYVASASAYAASAASAADDMAAADLIDFLDALLDAWEEACAKEDEPLWVPEAWEDEAVAFAYEMAEKHADA